MLYSMKRNPLLSFSHPIVWRAILSFEWYPIIVRNIINLIISCPFRRSPQLSAPQQRFSINSRSGAFHMWLFIARVDIIMISPRTCNAAAGRQRTTETRLLRVGAPPNVHGRRRSITAYQGPANCDVDVPRHLPAAQMTSVFRKELCALSGRAEYFWRELFWRR